MTNTLNSDSEKRIVTLPVERADVPWYRRLFRGLKRVLLSRLAVLVLYFLRLTLRWRKTVYAQPMGDVLNRPFILAFWHSRLVLPCWWYRDLGTGRSMQIIISAHGDGRIIAGAMEALGLEVITGSSSKGGARALAQMIRAARDGSDLCVTPDGPRGPAEQVKRGIIDLAMHSGLPIVPLSYRAGSFWRVRSWDRMIIPKPFSTAQFWVGAPIRVAKNASLGEREVLAKELSRVLVELGG